MKRYLCLNTILKIKKLLDVRFQGPSFSWDKFPSIFSEVCKSSLFNQYNNPKNLDELEEIACDSFMKNGNILKEEYYNNNNNFPLNLLG